MVLLFIISTAVVGTGLFIGVQLRPIDGRFGIPQQLVFPWCGQTYRLSDTGDSTLALIEDLQVADGPTILEPTIGKIPLLALFTSCPRYRGTFAQTVIWLSVGPDQYAQYALEGGP